MEEQRIVSVSEFKTHCLEYLEQMRTSKTECIVTKRGVPIAKLIPIKPTEAQEDVFAFGNMRGSITIKGDIIEPTNEEWDVC